MFNSLLRKAENLKGEYVWCRRPIKLQAVTELRFHTSPDALTAVITSHHGTLHNSVCPSAASEKADGNICLVRRVTIHQCLTQQRQ